MRCGKTQELVDWVVSSILDDPSRTMIVACSTPDQADELERKVREQLEKHVDNWRFSKRRVRTPEHGFIEYTGGLRDRIVRGYAVDEFLAHEDTDPTMVQTGVWTEKGHHKRYEAR